MSIISPAASYDSLTAEYRKILFHEAHYLSAEQLQQLERACAFAFHAHDGQTRKSGEPYITHPIAVATELARWRMDIQTLCAGLMHDVLEDTPVTKPKMAELFGSEIAEMVDGLSKLENLKYNSKAEHQAASFHKLIAAMIKDVRVIIVKLSDRLHNMRTLGAKGSSSRTRIAKETLEVYAPIANRLGMNRVYRDLQDLAFKAMYPTRYRVLKKAMLAFHKQRQTTINSVMQDMSVQLARWNVEARIRGREKNLYSIHQKMMRKKVKFEGVQDVYTFRVIVNSVPQCYAAMGALHALYEPRPGRFKDFIAIPKSNSYQSLHTALNSRFGLPVEVQIRTPEMDKMAEIGITNYWAAHSGKEVDIKSVNRWLENLKELQENSTDAMDFMENVKIDLFQNEIYLITPRGESVTLPRGSTPIDFAYAIHTDIGNSCVGARVNKVVVPLRTQLRTGDSVEIMTAPYGRPNPSWLNIVKSSRARSAIRNYVKNISRADAIALGERLLARAFNSLLPKNISQSEDLKEKFLQKLASKQQNFEDLLFDVGQGRILPVAVAMDIAELAGEHLGGEMKLGTIQVNSKETPHTQFCVSCKPIEGDVIRALMVRDQGVVIHRDTCEVLLKSDVEQQLDADWAALPVGMEKRYETAITVSAIDAHALLMKMAAAISEADGDIAAVDTLSKSQNGSGGFIEFRFTLNVRDVAHLQEIMMSLRQIPQIQKMTRL